VPKPELELIAAIRRAAARSRSRAVIAGIGDDAAVLCVPSGHDALVTTDFSIEGVHFRREWHPAESVGHRCLARGLSDIAAMGGEPVAAFLSLALPAEIEQRWVDSFLRGLLRLASKNDVTLAGGDIAESPGGVAADIVVVGSVPAGEELRRSGARAGDAIYVTGTLGASAATLARLRRGEKISPRAREHRAHFFPEPRLAIGRKLRGVASAAIDLSDGLSTDLAHICEASGVGAVIAEHSIPRGVTFDGSSLHYALHGGEDYELLFTAPRGARVPARVGKVRITRIGEIVADRQRRVFLSDSHGQRKLLKAGGWQHFGNAK
jgi:thiamine-monophosphate kinase